MSGIVMQTQTLRRLKQRLDSAARAARGEACQLCGAELPEQHAHLADVVARRLVCVCDVCAGTVRGETSDGALCPIPARCLRLPDDTVTDATWDALEIPVGIAFCFHSSSVDRPVVCYPGPAGATESLLPADAWRDAVEADAWLRTMTPDTEALLVRRDGGARACYLVPIETCYELVGRIRRRWTGFGGGDARDEIDAFFEGLDRRSRQVER